MEENAKHTWEADRTIIHGRRELVARLFLLQNSTYAGAPDLLAAAKNLIAAIEERTDKSIGSPFAKESNALRAAVAKMEGR